MIDFGSLEQRLNSDAAFRKSFFADPVGTLRQEGVLLSMQQQIGLRQCVSRLQARAGTGSFQGSAAKLGFKVEAAMKSE